MLSGQRRTDDVRSVEQTPGWDASGRVAPLNLVCAKQLIARTTVLAVRHRDHDSFQPLVGEPDEVTASDRVPPVDYEFSQ